MCGHYKLDQTRYDGYLKKGGTLNWVVSLKRVDLGKFGRREYNENILYKNLKN